MPINRTFCLAMPINRTFCLAISAPHLVGGTIASTYRGAAARLAAAAEAANIDRHGACEKNHLQGGRVGYTKALFAMAAHITAAVERRAAAAAAPPAKKKRTKKRKREGDVATTIASRTRARAR